MAAWVVATCDGSLPAPQAASRAARRAGSPPATVSAVAYTSARCAVTRFARLRPPSWRALARRT